MPAASGDPLKSRVSRDATGVDGDSAEIWEVQGGAALADERYKHCREIRE